MFEWLHQNLGTVGLIGGGLALLFADKIGPIVDKILALLKGIIGQQTAAPTVASTGGDVVAAFMTLKTKCTAPEAQAALKTLWAHLEPATEGKA